MGESTKRYSTFTCLLLRPSAVASALSATWCLSSSSPQCLRMDFSTSMWLTRSEYWREAKTGKLKIISDTALIASASGIKLETKSSI